LGAPGIMEHETGMVICFCGENLPNPLNSSKTGNYVNCSRNIGFVKVAKEVKQENFFLSNGP
jgi:hypothetical protein